MSDRKYLKWSNTTVNDADQYGNVWTANNIGNVPYGNFEGWYIGINPPVGGYTWYRYDTSGNGPYINCPPNDTELVRFYNHKMGTSFSNVPQVADAIAENNNQLLDGDVVRDGLLLYMDPNKTSSYPGTGTAVTNIAPSGSTNNIDGTLTNASMWVNPSDGPAYFRVETDDTNNLRVLTFDSQISRAGNGDSTLMFYWWSDYNANGQYSNSQAFFGGAFTNYMALESSSSTETRYRPEAETDGIGEPEGNHNYFAKPSDGYVFNQSEWSSWTSIFDSETASNWFNGTESSSTYTLGSSTTHYFTRLGSTATGDCSYPCRGGDIRMGALLLYNRVLSDAEIRKNLDIFDQWYSNS